MGESGVSTLVHQFWIPQRILHWGNFYFSQWLQFLYPFCDKAVLLDKWPEGVWRMPLCITSLEKTSISIIITGVTSGEIKMLDSSISSPSSSSTWSLAKSSTSSSKSESMFEWYVNSSKSDSISGWVSHIDGGLSRRHHQTFLAWKWYRRNSAIQLRGSSGNSVYNDNPKEAGTSVNSMSITLTIIAFNRGNVFLVPLFWWFLISCLGGV